jgi:hypothetical protein
MDDIPRNLLSRRQLRFVERTPDRVDSITMKND